MHAWHHLQSNLGGSNLLYKALCLLFAMVTIEYKVKVSLGGSDKEWLVPSQFITKASPGLPWKHWFQIRASLPGLYALLFPSALAATNTYIYSHNVAGMLMVQHSHA